jgi:hypothetical protein
MSLSQVVNVSVLKPQARVEVDNMNVVCLMTDGTDSIWGDGERYHLYNKLSEVEADFGTYSKTYSFAKIFFQQSPNPINAGGILAIGAYYKYTRLIEAKKASLTGTTLNAGAVVDNLRTIGEGTFTLLIAKNGGADVTLDLTLDFANITTIDDVALLIDAELDYHTCVFDPVSSKLVIESNTAGTATTVPNADENAIATVTHGNQAVTFVGEILGLTTPAIATDGADAYTSAVETVSEGLTAVKSLVNFKGFCFAIEPSNLEILAIADWAMANDAIYYQVFADSANLEADANSTAWAISKKKQEKVAMFYHDDLKLAIGAMALMHSVNFEALDSAKSLNLKEIVGIEGNFYTENDINKALKVGMSVYKFFKNLPKLLTSGANGWVDNAYNIMAFIDEVQVAAFNVLGGTPSKIPQTTRGAFTLINALEGVSDKFRRAGVFAPNVWNSPDTFGDIEVFKRNIWTNGYYWNFDPLSKQSQQDREARKSPVMRGAVKMAGAFHSVDIVINLDF